MRQAFYTETAALLDRDPRSALVLADISVAAFARSATDHPDRVLNVGIREQLLLGVTSGLALTGLRPIAHTYAPFLIERAWEQVKLDLSHQGVGAILVSVGASYDAATAGRTHHSPGDVALLDTLPDWTVHIPGHPAEVGAALRQAATDDGCVYIRLSDRHNSQAQPFTGRLVQIRPGAAGLVIAVGPMLDPVLAATEGLDVTVVYTSTPRPLDTNGLHQLTSHLPGSSRRAASVIMVEPYLAGTSAHLLTKALVDVPHRLLSLGVAHTDLHKFGTAADHDKAHGLDPAGLRHSIIGHLG